MDNGQSGNSPSIFKNFDSVRRVKLDSGDQCVLILSGWCFSPLSREPLKLVARLNGTLVSTFMCDEERPDLQSYFDDDLTKGSSIPYCGFLHQIDLDQSEGIVELACEELGVVIEQIDLKGLDKETDSKSNNTTTPSRPSNSNLINKPPEIFMNFDVMRLDQPESGGHRRLILSGWCFSPSSKEPLKIEARLNGTLVSTFICEGERSDLQSHFGEELAKTTSMPYCGFHHQIDLDQTEDILELTCEDLGVVIKKIILENLGQEAGSGNTIAVTPSWSIESNDD